MDSSALRARKRELRAEARAATGIERELQGRLCLSVLLGIPGLAGPGTVALYAALADEVTVELLFADLHARGWCVVFPRVEGSELALCEAAPDQLLPGRFGLREPPSAARHLAASQIDVFVVPGLLFARDGTRLGRGAGHYDRLLALARPDALRIGICYADRVRDALPSAPHDVPVHLLVTDRGVLRCRAPADEEESR